MKAKQIISLMILSILLLAYNCSKAQVPGYMGKRLTVGYGFYFNPAFASYLNGSGNTMFNKEHEMFIELVTGIQSSLGFSSRFYNTSYGNTRFVDVFPSSNSSSQGQVDHSPSGALSIRCVNYMLYTKSFYGNYLAPWGKYFIFGLTLNTFTSNYDTTDMRVKVFKDNPGYGRNYAYYSSFGPTEQSFKKFDILIGVGRNRIIGKSFTIDYGYNMNLIAMALTVFDAPDDNVLGDGDLSAIEYVKRTSASRVRGVNRFNFFVKFGFLF